jgi:hypothetical protein
LNQAAGLFADWREESAIVSVYAADRSVAQWRDPRFLFFVDPLAPVSGDPDVAPAAGDPSPGNPYRARPRRLGPVPTDPDIPSPVPAVISGHPDPARMQRRSWALDNNRRRGPSANNDLRGCRAYAQANPAYYDEQAFSDPHETLRKIVRQQLIR